MRLTLLLLAALLLPLCARAEIQTPDDILHEFYAWVLAHPSWALPSPAERAQLAKFVSPQLLQLLQEASVTEARCIQTTSKGDKPYVLEGDLFVGIYEGASEIAYGEMRHNGDIILVDVTLLYIDPRFPVAHPYRTVVWRDQLELRNTAAVWRVQDITFQANHSLVSGLQEYIATGKRSCPER